MLLSRLLSRRFTTSLESNSTTTKSIKEISSRLYDENNLKRQVEKFNKASEIARFRTRSGIYRDVVHRFASLKRYKYIEMILEHQKKYNDISKEGFSARLISLYGRSRMFDHAKKVFDEMPERNCKRTVLSFNALLGACVHSRKFDVAQDFFKDLPAELSIEPDLVSYNTILKVFCDTGELDSASSMLDDIMMNKGIEPDFVTFNTLLNGFYVKGRFDEGERIWDLMQKKNFSPDIRSYNAKLFGLALEKKTKEAVELFKDMEAKDIKPDVLSFNAMIKGFVNEGNLEEAKRWFEKLKESDCKPVKATFALLLPFLCQKDDLDYAFHLTNYIFDKRLIVDIVPVQVVVHELFKAGRIRDAHDLRQLARTYRYCHLDDLLLNPYCVLEDHYYY